MEFTYGNIKVNGIKSNNWKRMHGLALKTKAKDTFGGQLISLSANKYVSKRSRKKRRKARFRGCFNPFIEGSMSEEAKRIHHRYGYMPKKCKSLLKRKLYK